MNTPRIQLNIRCITAADQPQLGFFEKGRPCGRPFCLTARRQTRRDEKRTDFGLRSPPPFKEIVLPLPRSTSFHAAIQATN